MSACAWQPHIEGFFQNRLTEQDAEAFLLHLESCPACEARLELCWSRQDLAQSLHAAAEAPLPDTAKAQRRLLRALHQQPGGGQLIALVTQGLFKSVLALLEPVFGLLSGSEASAAD